MASKLEQAWFNNQKWVWLLAPLSLVFWLISALRRAAFRFGIFKQTQVDAPVVIVGNISVGGNGKTPMVIYLANLAHNQGFRPGVLSRGYGGKAAQYPMQVNSDSSTAEAGDEPVLMCQHLPCPLVVDPVRARGAQYLIAELGCDVIICDDGLQHYALARDIELVVMDGVRRLGNGFLLPMGPLREGKWRLDQVDLLVANGGEVSAGEHLMTLVPGALINLQDPTKTLPLAEIAQPVVAAAAIGNPQRFYNLLRQHNIHIESELSFNDHHAFSVGDLPEQTVIMTEKDAVKCRQFAHPDWWYLPVVAELDNDFNQAFVKKLRAVQQ